MNKEAPSISFCTTCLGRKEHLEETLPKSLEATEGMSGIEFVVLAYGDEEVADWVKERFPDEMKSGRIRLGYFELVPYEGKKNFHMTHAKNMAHRLATGEVLCNLDADNIVTTEFARWLQDTFSGNEQIYARKSDSSPSLSGGTGGRIAVRREDFYRARGYLESEGGWGPDDTNFAEKLEHIGLSLAPIPPTLLEGTFIRHSDDMRMQNYGQKVQEESRGRIGSQLKYAIGNPVAFGCGAVRINDESRNTVLGVSIPDSEYFTERFNRRRARASKESTPSAAR